MKRKIKNSNDITQITQDVLAEFVDKKIGVSELVAVSRMADTMTKIAVAKTAYNKFQNDHSEIEYLEGN